MMAIAAAAMLAVPVSTASWSAMGQLEPDNKYDAVGNFNWKDAPGASTNRIYFQVFTSEFGFNPNVGAEGTLVTHFEPTTIESVYGLLGVWRDCNGDGYIGLAESAALEYPASLLSTTAVCPAITGGNTVGAYRNLGYPSNYNGWVTEFIHIGGNGSDPDDDASDARVIRDSEAKMWGDFGLPDDTTAASGGTCAITPLPRGTTQSTGGLLDYADCSTGLLELYNSVFLGRTVAGNEVPGADEGNSLGLVFVDDDNGMQDGHPLNQANPAGPEDSEGAAVVITDCQTVVFDSGETINSTGITETTGELDGSLYNVTIYQPAPSLNGGTSLAGQYNQTNEDFDDCDTSNDNGHDFYPEGDFSGSVQFEGKTQAEWNFGFNDFVRGEQPWGAAAGQVGRQPWGPSGFIGAFRVTGLVFFAGPVWSGDASLVKAGQNTVRASVADGTVEPDAPWIETYYAYVGGASTTSFVLPNGGATVKYGASQCTGKTGFDPVSGWNCSPEEWYLNADGTPKPEPTEGWARVGDLYQLRDIDCYDGNAVVAGSGVPLGGPANSANPCN